MKTRPNMRLCGTDPFTFTFTFIGIFVILLISFQVVGATEATLQSPIQGYKFCCPFPQFTWSEHPAAFREAGRPVSYEIVISRDSGFASIVHADTIYLNRYVPDQPLEPGMYYWRVRACQDGNPLEDWTSAASFTVAGFDRAVRIVDGDDAGANVRAAVKTARHMASGGQSVQILFSPGDYYIAKKYTGALLDFDDDRDIIIQGNGARVHFVSRTQCLLQANHSTNLMVQNLEVHFPRNVTSLQGWVRAIDPKNNRVTVWFPNTNMDYSSEGIRRGLTIINLMDPKIDGRLKAGAANFFRTKGDYQKNIDGTWSFTINGKVSDWAVGDRFVQQLRADTQSLIRLQDCNSITVHGLTSFGAAGMNFTAFGGAIFNILHCRILRDDQAWFGGGADGVHCRGMTIGPWIEGCAFNALGDDGIALYARPSTLWQIHPGGDKNAVICREEFFNLEPGNSVAFFRPQDGTILLETVVKNVTSAGAGRFTVVFADPVPDGLRIDRSILDTTQLWNLSKSCGDFMIRNNHLENIRRYGTVFRAQRGVIEDNSYVGTSASAILSFNETQYPNGLYASDIIIRKNRIEDSGFESHGAAAPLAMNFVGQNGAAKSFGPHCILIEVNVFKNTPSPEIMLVSGQDIVVLQNQVKIKAGNDIPVRLFRKNTRNVSIDP